jgi:plasmid stabilization system protein ParE
VARYRVEITPRARAQVHEISSWWRANRPGHAALFREELTGVKRHLERFPASGPAYDSPEHGDVRRMLLLRSQHYAYYVIDEQLRVVTILAVWHTARGSGPPL